MIEFDENEIKKRKATKINWKHNEYPIHFSTVYVMIKGKNVPLRAIYDENTKLFSLVNGQKLYLSDILSWCYKFKI